MDWGWSHPLQDLLLSLVVLLAVEVSEFLFKMA
jgi:hypothetical protein